MNGLACPVKFCLITRKFVSVSLLKLIFILLLLFLVPTKVCACPAFYCLLFLPAFLQTDMGMTFIEIVGFLTANILVFLLSDNYYVFLLPFILPGVRCS